MRLINLTPHEVTIALPDGRMITIPPSGRVARVSTVQEIIGTVETPDGYAIPVVETRFGEIDGLPEPEDGTIYIVSSLVAQAVAGRREDVMAPDTGPTALRDGDGRILAVRRLQIWR